MRTKPNDVVNSQLNEWIDLSRFSGSNYRFHRMNIHRLPLTVTECKIRFCIRICFACLPDVFRSFVSSPFVHFIRLLGAANRKSQSRLAVRWWIPSNKPTTTRFSRIIGQSLSAVNHLGVLAHSLSVWSSETCQTFSLAMSVWFCSPRAVKCLHYVCVLTLLRKFLPKPRSGYRLKRRRVTNNRFSWEKSLAI